MKLGCTIFPGLAACSSTSSRVTARTRRESKAQNHVGPNHQKLQQVAGSAAPGDAKAGTKQTTTASMNIPYGF